MFRVNSSETISIQSRFKAHCWSFFSSIILEILNSWMQTSGIICSDVLKIIMHIKWTVDGRACVNECSRCRSPDLCRSEEYHTQLPFFNDVWTCVCKQNTYFYRIILNSVYVCIDLIRTLWAHHLLACVRSTSPPQRWLLFRNVHSIWMFFHRQMSQEAGHVQNIKWIIVTLSFPCTSKLDGGASQYVAIQINSSQHKTAWRPIHK